MDKDTELHIHAIEVTGFHGVSHQERKMPCDKCDWGHDNPSQQQGDDGGSAFPHEVPDHVFDHQASQGMTLRDYFAAAALPAALSSLANANQRVPQDKTVAEFAAILAYEAADAMLKEREK